MKNEMMEHMKDIAIMKHVFLTWVDDGLRRKPFIMEKTLTLVYVLSLNMV